MSRRGPRFVAFGLPTLEKLLIKLNDEGYLAAEVLIDAYSACTKPLSLMPPGNSPPSISIEIDLA